MALILAFYLSIFLYFQGTIVSQISQELLKLESSNLVNIYRIYDCIVELGLRVMSFIILFLSIFLSFPIFQ